MMQWPKAPGNVAMPSLRAKGSWESPRCSSTSASLQGDASCNDTDGNHTPLLRPVSLSHAEAVSKGWCRRWAPRADCAQSLTVTESLFGYYHWSLGSTRAAQLLFVCLQHCAITGDFLCSSSFSSDALRCHCLDLTCLWCWSFGCVFPLELAGQLHHSSFFFAPLRFRTMSAICFWCFYLAWTFVLTLTGQRCLHHPLLFFAPVGLCCLCLWWCCAFGSAFTLGFARHSHLFGGRHRWDHWYLTERTEQRGSISVGDGFGATSWGQHCDMGGCRQPHPTSPSAAVRAAGSPRQ